MKEKHKIIKYQSGNIKTETYQDGDTLVTKHYHNEKDAYVSELIHVQDGVTKIKHVTARGVASKLEHFVDGKRDGQETKYFVSKADGSIKSTKLYKAGKLHGANITYNEKAEVIKHEVFALGKRVLKYLRENDENNDITNVEILDKENLVHLPEIESEKFHTLINHNPENFVK